MCILCGLTQSIPLLTIGYTPTEADMARFLEMNQKIAYLGQVEQLAMLENKIEDRKKSPSYQESKKKQYYIGVAEDFIQREKIFTNDL